MKRYAWLIHLSAVVSLLLAACASGAPAAPSTAAPGATAQGAVPTAAASAAAGQATPQPTSAGALTEQQIASLPLDSQRQQILEDGARKEGALMVYTTSTSLDGLIQAFEAKYPFIKADLYSSRGDPLTQRTLAEAKAGRMGADVLRIDTAIYTSLKDLLLPFNSPGASFNVVPNAATGNYDGIGFTYSTDRVAPADVPKTVQDLLSPRWKGNLGLFAPPNNYPGRWTGELIQAMGDQQARDFLQKLGDQQPTFYTQPETARNGLLSGEYDLNMQGITTGILSHRSGDPIGWALLDPASLTPALYGLANGAPHPYAAMLFLDFVLSPDGLALSDQAEGSITPDELTNRQKEGVVLPPQIDIEQPLETDQLQQWMDLFNQLVAHQ